MNRHENKQRYETKELASKDNEIKRLSEITLVNKMLTGFALSVS